MWSNRGKTEKINLPPPFFVVVGGNSHCCTVGTDVKWWVQSDPQADGCSHQEKSTRCFWGVSTDPSKGLTPRAHRRAAPRARTEAGGRCHEHWLVRGCSSTYEQSVGLSQRRNTAEILREGGCMSPERHRELQTSLQEKLGDVPSRTHVCLGKLCASF